MELKNRLISQSRLNIIPPMNIRKNRGGSNPSPIIQPLNVTQGPVRMGNGCAFVQADEPPRLLFALIR